MKKDIQYRGKSKFILSKRLWEIAKNVSLRVYKISNDILRIDRGHYRGGSTTKLKF